MSAHQLLRLAGLAGILSGVVLAVDGVVDLVADDTAARGVGVLSPLFGLFAVTGIYLWMRARRPSLHLDLGYALNLVGLALFAAVAFTRSFALAELDEPVRDALVESGPTLPLLISAGVIAVCGVILFATALLRSGYDAAPSLLYLVAVPIAGFGALMPPAVSMVAQLAAGAAIVLLARSLLTALGRAPDVAVAA